MRDMSILLILAYLFFIGSVLGWILELLYRGYRHKKWVNPGFCRGPYLPIYGCSLCILYLLALLEQYFLITNPFWNKIALFTAITVCLTLMEYVAGLFCLKILKVRLWDYSNCWGNIQGIICPRFSLYWSIMGAIYCFLIHSQILDALDWISQNLSFSFFIGMFYGIFLIDVISSAQLVVKLKQFAEENAIVLIYEEIKDHIRNSHLAVSAKYHFFSPFRSERLLTEHLKEIAEKMERQIRKHQH